MRELAKDVAKQMDLFDKKGQPLAGEDREKAIAKTKQDLQEFQSLMFAGKKWEVSDWLNFDAMKRKMRETMEGAVTKAEIRDLFVAPGKLAELNQRITTGLGKIKLDVFVGDPSKLAGKSMEEQFHAAEQSLTQQRTLSKEVKQAYDDQRDALAQIDSRQRQIAGNLAVQKDDAVGVFQAHQGWREHAHRRVRDHGQGRSGCGDQEIPRDQRDDLADAVASHADRRQRHGRPAEEGPRPEEEHALVAGP